MAAPARLPLGLFNEYDEVVRLLRSAADLFEAAYRNHTAPVADNVASAGSAAWRAADATGLMRHLLEREGIEGNGITVATGRGFVLPKKGAS